MSYKTKLSSNQSNPMHSATIADIVSMIESRRLFLPPIQRPFVWKDDQIERLFDSIMHGYPFGTMLFWHVKKDTVNNNNGAVKLYEFIKHFSEYDNFEHQECETLITNSLYPEDSVDAVLDGQQRLMALYTSLCGSISRKIKYKHAGISTSFTRKELYYDVVEDCFRLLETKEENCFSVKKVIQATDKDLLITNAKKEYGEIIAEKILRLYTRLHSDRLIYYYQIETDSIDEAVEIFVRINSGGLVLSRADLFFSKLVASWGKEGREAIQTLRKQLRDEHFYLDNNFVIRASLYLIGLSTSLRIGDFTSTNAMEIETKWKDISKAIKSACTITKKLGFTTNNLVSENALFPIAYAEFKGYTPIINKQSVGVQCPEYKKYLIVSQLNGLFSQGTNTTLKNIRDVLDVKKRFEYDDFKDINVGNKKPLNIDVTTLEKWMDFEKGEKSKMLLSLFYDIDFSNGFHQDHLHPYASFNRKRDLCKIKKIDGTFVTKEEAADWQELRNKVPNLQLLSGPVNNAKQKISLIDWLAIPANMSWAQPLLPVLSPDLDYSLGSFGKFYDERKQLLIDCLKGILNIV